jgi:2-dehydropantoate 2-reductase
MRIAIVGAGALGCYYGSLLVRGGYDVHFLMRRDYETVRQKGLTVKSCNGDFSLYPLQCYRRPEDMGQADLVFIGLKTTANDQYAELILPLLGAHTRILTAQNGLGNEEQLAGLFGAERISGGLAFLNANRQEPGVLLHLGHGQIKIGNFNRPPDQPLVMLGEMLKRSGVDCFVTDNLALARWQKLVWNVPFNGLSALHDLTVDVLVREPEFRRLVRALMGEVQAAAASYGLVIEDAFLEQMIASHDSVHTPYYTSMHLDRLNRRRMEIDAILGEPLRRGRQNGVAMPYTEKLYRDLKTLQDTF